MFFLMNSLISVLPEEKTKTAIVRLYLSFHVAHYKLAALKECIKSTTTCIYPACCQLTHSGIDFTVMVAGSKIVLTVRLAMLLVHVVKSSNGGQQNESSTNAGFS